MALGWNSNYDYQVKLTDDGVNAIADKLVEFTIIGKQYFAKTDSDGFKNIKHLMLVL